MNEETLVTSETTTTPEGEAVVSADGVEAPEAQEQLATGENQGEAEASSEQTDSDDSKSTDDTESKDSEPKQLELELKNPEGMEIDGDSMSVFKQVAKDLELTQEQAQTMLEKMAPAMNARQAELMSKARDDWRQQATTDKEFGGDQLNANLAVAKKAMDAFGTPELTKLLNESGLGNHPEVIRVFYRAGKAISEDGFVSGQSTQSRVDDPAKRLFPNQL
jgi:hypothetical protein